MPPLSSAAKSKGKSRDGRRSRSRNTTPSSVLSAGTAPPGPTTTPFLELDATKLLVPERSQYGEILDKFEGKDLKHSQELIEQLKHLSDAAEKRADLCSAAVRTLHEQWSTLEAEHKEWEREQAEQSRRLKARQDAKNAADAAASSQKGGKARKRKDRGEVESVETEIKREAGRNTLRAGSTPGVSDSPSPAKKARQSPDTSPLSDVAGSPEAIPGLAAQASPSKTDASMDDVEENRIIHKPPPVLQTGYFPDPLAPDPTIYHIREVTPGMTDEEKKEIYSVTAFPTKDLSDQIAGTPPDKDFSNAKPTNQVAASTFLAYVDPYVRPLTEEDMAFLRERGDRTTPFLQVPRGKRHYTEIWAEEDQTYAPEHKGQKYPPNQARGSLEDVSEENVGTDAVSLPPLASRLLSLLRYEHRAPPAEKNETTNGDNTFMHSDGNDTMDLDGLTNGHDETEKQLPPAASVADLTGSKSNLFQKLDYLQTDERIKAELRHLNLLGPDENPDYDAHHDDDISERLRLLQTELKRVMIVNGARKTRLEKIAQERLAFQEYSTIHEDLDMQVQQAYLKRTRTLGKTKKGGPGVAKPKAAPGTAGHLANGSVGGPSSGSTFGVNRARDIGDNARILMDRRKRWEECIGPVFEGLSHGVPGKDTTLWDPRLMEALEKEEAERLFEEETD